MDDEPLTERRSVTGPRVFGYLRHLTGSTARHTALADCLTEYCHSHELTLCGVFTDREPAIAIRAPAFVGLLDALQLPDVYGVLVPALGHLGPRHVAAERKRLITATGVRLIVVRSAKPTAGSEHLVRLQLKGGT
ncbi:recombinase family protein [Streptomyces sp. T028]|uniref:recombinase family protein n=1 Tax=Streptomyces sp. T028 TaxID=3394379 RepID=UPI003A83E602